MAISMEKIEREAPGLVSLAKKAQFAVSKYDLGDVNAKVALVLDYSYSAEDLYRSGAIQAAAERILAMATQFDDDGAIDVFFFHNDAWYAGELTLSDYQGGVNRLVGNKRMGGTNYAAAFDAVTEHYFPAGKKGRFGFGKTSEPDLSVPVYVAFLTDGATSDEYGALTAAKASSEYPIFFQSVGLGNASYFSFIENSLNNHGGKVDNFGFFTAPDIAALSDVALLDGLLNEFPGALDKMKAAGTLV